MTFLIKWVPRCHKTIITFLSPNLFIALLRGVPSNILCCCLHQISMICTELVIQSQQPKASQTLDEATLNLQTWCLCSKHAIQVRNCSVTVKSDLLTCQLSKFVPCVNHFYGAGTTRRIVQRTKLTAANHQDQEQTRHRHYTDLGKHL